MDLELILKLEMKNSIQELFIMWQRQDKSTFSSTYILKMDMAFAYAFQLAEDYRLTPEFRDRLAQFQSYVATISQNE
jgi:hypothetical protein